LISDEVLQTTARGLCTFVEGCQNRSELTIATTLIVPTLSAPIASIFALLSYIGIRHGWDEMAFYLLPDRLGGIFSVSRRTGMVMAHAYVVVVVVDGVMRLVVVELPIEMSVIAISCASATMREFRSKEICRRVARCSFHKSFNIKAASAV